MSSPTDRDLAQILRDDEPVQGLIVKMPAPSVVEMAAYAGFDFVFIDAEHGMGDDEALEHHIRAADAAGIPCIVRIGELSAIQILRALDAGATGIVVPHVGDVEAAERAVRFAHYPPFGQRGLAVSTRAGQQGTVGLPEHVKQARLSTIVIVQVEDSEAVDRVEEIVTVPRVDAVFLGPTDLSMSLGHPGELDHPVVALAIERVANAVVANGRPALCVLASNEEERTAWLARGARIILFTAHGLFNERLRQVASDDWRNAPGAGIAEGHGAQEPVQTQLTDGRS